MTMFNVPHDKAEINVLNDKFQSVPRCAAAAIRQRLSRFAAPFAENAPSAPFSPPCGHQTRCSGLPPQAPGCRAQSNQPERKLSCSLLFAALFVRDFLCPRFSFFLFQQNKSFVERICCQNRTPPPARLRRGRCCSFFRGTLSPAASCARRSERRRCPPAYR